MKDNSLEKINSVTNKLDNLDKITFSELLRVASYVKVKTLWAIALGFISYTSAVSFVAMGIQESKTAIALHDAFDISIKKDAVRNCTKLSNPEDLLCKKIYMAEKPSPSDTGKLHLELRIIDEKSSMTSQVGTVLAKKRVERKVPFFPVALNMSQPVLAQGKKENFNWLGHKNNFEFYEKYINKNTIRRYYKDGWILEYRVDQNKRSIPSSFTWIRKGGCFLNVCF